MSRKNEAERQEAINRLREILKPGDTVYTSLRSVSRSGMTRKIRVHFFQIDDKGVIRPYQLSYPVAKILGWRFDEKTLSISVRGCGMDMGWHLAYSLSCALFPDGFGVEGEGPYGHKVRPKSKELAAKMVEKGWKSYGRNGDTSGWDDDGGYALKHEWL